MSKSILETAEKYQSLDRKIKDLQAKQKPLKKELLEYAQDHRFDFDEAFQLKFENGTYISQRVKDVVEGDKENKAKLLDYNEDFVKQELNETKVIELAPTDPRLRKFLTKNNLKISQKESFAVYAS